MSLVFSLVFLPLHSLFPALGAYAVSFTQLGPLASVLLLAYLFRGQGMLKELGRKFELRGLTWRWAAMVLFLTGVPILMSGLVLSFMGIKGVAWAGSPLFYGLNLVGVVVGALAEESGWRGYLLPKFQERYTPLKSAVFTGIIWGVWHLNFTGGIPGFLLYTVTIIETSILMTWIYNRTKGNLTLMVLYHILFNLFSRMLLWQRFRLELFVVESLVFGILCFYIYASDRESLMQSHPIPKTG